VNGAGVNAAVRSRGGIKLPQEATARLIEQVTPGAA
jgi:hypothetical protein